MRRQRKKQKDKRREPIGIPFKRPAWSNSLAIAPWGSEKHRLYFGMYLRVLPVVSRQQEKGE